MELPGKLRRKPPEEPEPAEAPPPVDRRAETLAHLKRTFEHLQAATAEAEPESQLSAELRQAWLELTEACRYIEELQAPAARPDVRARLAASRAERGAARERSRAARDRFTAG